MPIHFHIELPGFKLKQPATIKRWLKTVVSKEGKKPGELNYILTSDKKVLDINNQYLKHDYFTDIITFDLSVDNRPDGFLKPVRSGTVTGDIYISLERVKDNAERYEVSAEEELRRVMVHGVLHLFGYKDKTTAQKKEMRAKEDYYLRLFYKT